ncbi:MAG: GNAT family N-acetyltransferase [Planctomycetota bacterium]
MSAEPVLETPRLVLRTFMAGDEEAMAEVLCDPEVMWFSMGSLAPGEVGAWLEERVEHEARHGFGLWAVCLGTTGDVIGYCGLARRPEGAVHPEVELGFRLARRRWAQGYATEAASAVLDHAFTSLGLARVIALVDPANAASVRVVEKLGMRYEADVMLPGYDHPDRLYAASRPPRPGYTPALPKDGGPGEPLP